MSKETTLEEKIRQVFEAIHVHSDSSNDGEPWLTDALRVFPYQKDGFEVDVSQLGISWEEFSRKTGINTGISQIKQLYDASCFEVIINELKDEYGSAVTITRRYNQSENHQSIPGITSAITASTPDTRFEYAFAFVQDHADQEEFVAEIYSVNRETGVISNERVVTLESFEKYFTGVITTNSDFFNGVVALWYINQVNKRANEEGAFQDVVEVIDFNQYQLPKRVKIYPNMLPEESELPQLPYNLQQRTHVMEISSEQITDISRILDTIEKNELEALLRADLQGEWSSTIDISEIDLSGTELYHLVSNPEDKEVKAEIISTTIRYSILAELCEEVNSQGRPHIRVEKKVGAASGAIKELRFYSAELPDMAVLDTDRDESIYAIGTFEGPNNQDVYATRKIANQQTIQTQYQKGDLDIHNGVTALFYLNQLNENARQLLGAPRDVFVIEKRDTLGLPKSVSIDFSAVPDMSQEIEKPYLEILLSKT